MVARIFSKASRFKSIELLLKYLRFRALLLKLRLKRCALSLKLGTRFLYIRVKFIKHEKALLEDRRRAMFVDEFFNKLKHPDSLSVVDGE